MNYVADIQALPVYGRYTIEPLTPKQAATWLSSHRPIISHLRHERLKELLATVTGYADEQQQGRLPSEARLDAICTGDQVLACYVKTEIFLNSPKWYEFSWPEQLDRLQLILLSCEHRYAESDLLPVLPISKKEFIVPPPLRVVIGEPTIPGAGRFNFQPITVEQAQAWLTVSFRSRMRFGKQALALGMLTGTHIHANFDGLPQMRPCDQALVFFPGARCRSKRLRDMRAEEMVKRLDLALITPLSEMTPRHEPEQDTVLRERKD